MSSLIEIMPPVMLSLVVIYLLVVTFTKQSDCAFIVIPWQFPAIVSLFFAGWSVYTVIEEGFTAVWSEHTRYVRRSASCSSEIAQIRLMHSSCAHSHCLLCLYRNLWGNQIWFDLIYGIAVSWTLILPRAREVNLNVVAWLVFVLVTANIGLLAMLSRVLYLEEQKRNQGYATVVN